MYDGNFGSLAGSHQCSLEKQSSLDVLVIEPPAAERSERGVKSNFPIKCIYNLNIFNRKTEKYTRRHTICI